MEGGRIAGGNLVVKGCGVERSPTTFALHVDIGDGSKQVHDLVEALPGSEEHENERGGFRGHRGGAEAVLSVNLYGFPMTTALTPHRTVDICKLYLHRATVFV